MSFISAFTRKTDRGIFFSPQKYSEFLANQHNSLLIKMRCNNTATRNEIFFFGQNLSLPVIALQDKGSRTNLCFPGLPRTRNLPINF